MGEVQKPTAEQIMTQIIAGQRDSAMTQVAQLQAQLHISQERIKELEQVEEKSPKKGK